MSIISGIDDGVVVDWNVIVVFSLDVCRIYNGLGWNDGGLLWALTRNVASDIGNLDVFGKVGIFD